MREITNFAQQLTTGGIFTGCCRDTCVTSHQHSHPALSMPDPASSRLRVVSQQPCWHQRLETQLHNSRWKALFSTDVKKNVSSKGSSFLCCSCHGQQLSGWKGRSDEGLSSLAWMVVSSFLEQLHSPWELNKRREMCPEVGMWHIEEQCKSSPFQLNHPVSFFLFF